ncbi:hypothetical protein [Streptomyces zagrosensis]|uniref:Uncharacterized protein n=1 Tax=Streptomyces zagrosensis TaxID=1042984 RepID=A0A7W9QF91_9ACTN|nr:hypothetical protein [Streptomyces zagrosensis]MBB5938919.1 hypothetical protein [Streptomyces zagrosensis]
MNRPRTRPSVVPFIASWNSELPDLVAGLTIEYDPESRLAYKGLPLPTDRDLGGISSARMSHSPHVGKPIFDGVHPTRQRFCMFEMSCQVCGWPASRNKDG